MISMSWKLQFSYFFAAGCYIYLLLSRANWYGESMQEEKVVFFTLKERNADNTSYAFPEKMELYK